MKVFISQRLEKGIGLGFGLCLIGLILTEVGGAADVPTIDPARDTIEFLREEGLTAFGLGELVASTKQRFGPISRVYEVTAEDILKQNTRNVGEALRFVPGIIYGQGGFQNQGSISIRG